MFMNRNIYIPIPIPMLWLQLKNSSHCASTPEQHLAANNVPRGGYRTRGPQITENELRNFARNRDKTSLTTLFLDSYFVLSNKP